MKLVSVFSSLLLLLCLSCSVDRQEVPGVYVVKNLEQSIDTLKVFPNGIYKRYLYSGSGKLLYSNSNKWNYIDGDLILKDFLIDEDQTHSSEEVMGTGSINCFLPVRTRLTKVVIYYRHGGDDTFFYEKL